MNIGPAGHGPRRSPTSPSSTTTAAGTATTITSSRSDRMGDATRIAAAARERDRGRRRHRQPVEREPAASTYYADSLLRGLRRLRLPARLGVHHQQPLLRPQPDRQHLARRQHAIATRSSSCAARGSTACPASRSARNHRDAQFYLLDARVLGEHGRPPDLPGRRAAIRCAGASATTTRTRGARAATSPGSPTTCTRRRGAPRDEDITAAWTFGGRWDPEATLPAVLPLRGGSAARRRLALGRSGRRRRCAGRRAATRRAHRVYFGEDDAPPFRAEQGGTTFDTGPLVAGPTYHWRIDTVTPAGVVAGRAWSFVAVRRENRT